jgi:hypothetical protein
LRASATLRFGTGSAISGRALRGRRDPDVSERAWQA